MNYNKKAATIYALLIFPLAAAGDRAEALAFDLQQIDARAIAGDATPVPQPAAAPAMSPAELASHLSDYESVMELAAENLEKATQPKTPVTFGGDGVIRLYHKWSGESLHVRYRGQDGRHLPEAMAKISHFMRCRLTNKEIPTPAKLVEILDIIQEKAGNKTITVTCGYRSPEFNDLLIESAPTVVAKNSMHIKGWAADITIEGLPIEELRDIAKSIAGGGVGYYPKNNFVHIDIGPVRYW